MKATLERIFAGLAALLICAGASPAADLHPIVEVQSGYLFGATSNGKWIKADETAKLIGHETTYRVYGLTQALGDAKGDKPKPANGPCEETLAVSLSPETEKGVIAIAAPWNALPRKPQVTDPTQKTYVDAVRDFLKTKEIDQPKVKIDNILRIDLDGDGEEERSFNQRDKLFQERRKRANAIASRKLFDGVVAARGRWKSGNAIDRRRILSQGLSEGRTRRGALRRAERLQSDRDAGSGRRRQNGNRGRLELLRRRSGHNLALRS